MSLEENGSEGSLKYIYRRVVHKLKISIVGAAQLIFIGGKSTKNLYINRRSGPIDIYTSEGCSLIK